MLQIPKKLKNYRLRWFSKPLRLAKFESLWIQICSIVAVLGYHTIFLFLLLLSLNFLTEFSQWFYSDSLLLNATSLLDASPFYSVILVFRGTTDSPPLLPWVPEPTLYQPLWWLVISLFLIVFFFWCYFPKSFLLTFYYGVSLDGWPPISLPSRLLIFTFFRFSFWLSFFLSFFPGEPNPFLLGWRFTRLLLFIVLLSGLPEVLAPCS